jgi:hypothetical protein
MAAAPLVGVLSYGDLVGGVPDRSLMLLSGILANRTAVPTVGIRRRATWLLGARVERRIHLNARAGLCVSSVSSACSHSSQEGGPP